MAVAQEYQVGSCGSLLAVTILSVYKVRSSRTCPPLYSLYTIARSFYISRQRQAVTFTSLTLPFLRFKTRSPTRQSVALRHATATRPHTTCRRLCCVRSLTPPCHDLTNRIRPPRLSNAPDTHVQRSARSSLSQAVSSRRRKRHHLICVIRRPKRHRCDLVLGLPLGLDC